MNKIKDFFYNFFDAIVALVLIGLIAYVLITNVTYLMDIDTSVVLAKVETYSTNDHKMTIDATIPQDISQEQLADVLVAYKLINNKEEFLEILSKTDYTNIKSGDFSIEEDSSYEDIIKELTE